GPCRAARARRRRRGAGALRVRACRASSRRESSWRAGSVPYTMARGERLVDLKTLVRELADELGAIYQPQAGGFAIEVPQPNERFQSVVVAHEKREGVLRVTTSVGDLSSADQG